jgi:hypothetical protein
MTPAEFDQAPTLPEASAFDCTDSPRHWSREQRVILAHQLYGSISTIEIARRLEVAPGTISDYMVDPTGQRARARRQRRPSGRCQGCGCDTGPDRGDRHFTWCPRCASKERIEWCREDVIDAYLDWWARFGREPSSTDWNHTHADRRGGAALLCFHSRRWPTLTVVNRLIGPWPRLVAEVRVASRGHLHRATHQHVRWVDQDALPFRALVVSESQRDPNSPELRVGNGATNHIAAQSRPRT